MGGMVMKIQLVRHATFIIHYHGLKILVDPMFSPAGGMATVANAENTLRNPLVNLPMDVSTLFASDAVLLTHSHRDHLDDVAVALLPKDITFFCQPEDATRLRDLGFTNVTPVDHALTWKDTHFIRTFGMHGSGELADKMGPVSGYVLEAPAEPRLYIAGDTVWCADVQDALSTHQPDVTVLFAGAAQFLTGGPITMDEQGISEVCRHAAGKQVVIGHMEAWSHCLMKRVDLQRYLVEKNLAHQVIVPQDGDIVEFNL
jgi:L-ascorbate metabolism protein UlaG (beta-lactamase superfamily)